MAWRHPTPEDWDHAADHRKHDFDPPLPKVPPARLTPPIAAALEVAVLVKGIADPREGAKLVEQYAQTVAAAARLQAVIDTSDKIIAQIEGHHAQA